MDICFTSDVHGYLTERDFNTPESAGYLECAEHFPPGALIIDGGDILQGSPLAMYTEQGRFSYNPMAKAFREVGVKYFVPGNHDFNFTEAYLSAFIEESKVEVLCANIESGAFPVKPYAIYEQDGIKVALIGVTTEYIKVWEKKENLSQTRILDTVRSAKAALEEARKADPDYTICIYHGGYENSFSGSPLPDTVENRAGELIALGFDVVLTGHQHVHHDYRLNGCISLQNLANGKSYVHLHLPLDAGEPSIFFSDEGKYYPSEKLRCLREEIGLLNDEVDSLLSVKIGRTEEVFSDDDKLWSMTHPSALADFFNTVSLEVTGADVAVCSLFNDPVSLGPEVSVGDIIRAYPFANALYVIEADGAVLKAALERAATFLTVEEGKIAISESALVPKKELYNYDYAYGCEYTFDISKREGERVVKLTHKGVDLLEHPESTFRMAINNYRLSGTGGYGMYPSCKVLESFSTDFQHLLIEYFQAHVDVKTPIRADFSCIF